MERRYIFVGKVKEIKDFQWFDSENPVPPNFKYKFHKTIVFDVEKFYKGSSEKVSNTKEITLYSVSQTEEAPFSFDKDEKYLVYVKRIGVVPVMKNWIYADIVESGSLTNKFTNSSETIKFLESVYQTDFNFIRDLLGYTGDTKYIFGGAVGGKAINLAKPHYPKEAKEVKAQGSINVQVLIDESGKVILAKAICPSNSSLAKVSEQAALNSQFMPTTISNKPVKITGVIVYNFYPEIVN